MKRVRFQLEEEGKQTSEKSVRQASLLMANQEFQRVQWRDLQLQGSKGIGARLGKTESSVAISYA